MEEVARLTFKFLSPISSDITSRDTIDVDLFSSKGREILATDTFLDVLKEGPNVETEEVINCLNGIEVKKKNFFEEFFVDDSINIGFFEPTGEVMTFDIVLSGNLNSLVLNLFFGFVFTKYEYSLSGNSKIEVLSSAIRIYSKLMQLSEAPSRRIIRPVVFAKILVLSKKFLFDFYKSDFPRQNSRKRKKQNQSTSSITALGDLEKQVSSFGVVLFDNLRKEEFLRTLVVSHDTEAGLSLIKDLISFTVQFMATPLEETTFRRTLDQLVNFCFRRKSFSVLNFLLKACISCAGKNIRRCEKSKTGRMLCESSLLEGTNDRIASTILALLDLDLGNFEKTCFSDGIGVHFVQAETEPDCNSEVESASEQVEEDTDSDSDYDESKNKKKKKLNKKKKANLKPKPTNKSSADSGGNIGVTLVLTCLQHLCVQATDKADQRALLCRLLGLIFRNALNLSIISSKSLITNGFKDFLEILANAKVIKLRCLSVELCGLLMEMNYKISNEPSFFSEDQVMSLTQTVVNRIKDVATGVKVSALKATLQIPLERYQELCLSNIVPALESSKPLVRKNASRSMKRYLVEALEHIHAQSLHALTWKTCLNALLSHINDKSTSIRLTVVDAVRDLLEEMLQSKKDICPENIKLRVFTVKCANTLLLGLRDPEMSVQSKAGEIVLDIFISNLGLREKDNDKSWAVWGILGRLDEAKLLLLVHCLAKAFSEELVRIKPLMDTLMDIVDPSIPLETNENIGPILKCAWRLLASILCVKNSATTMRTLMALSNEAKKHIEQNVFFSVWTDSFLQETAQSGKYNLPQRTLQLVACSVLDVISGLSAVDTFDAKAAGRLADTLNLLILRSLVDNCTFSAEKKFLLDNNVLGKALKTLYQLCVSKCPESEQIVQQWANHFCSIIKDNLLGLCADVSEIEESLTETFDRRASLAYSFVTEGKQKEDVKSVFELSTEFTFLDINKGKDSSQDATKLSMERLCRSVFLIGEISILGFDFELALKNLHSRCRKIDIDQDVISLIMAFLVNENEQQDTPQKIDGADLANSPIMVKTMGILDKLRTPKTVGRTQSALSSTTVQAHSVLALGKLCLTDGGLAKELVQWFTSQLRSSPNEILRLNLLMILSDLCKGQTSLMSSVLTELVATMTDPSFIVRKAAIVSITNLVQQDYIKFNKLLLTRFIMNFVDPGKDYSKEKVRESLPMVEGTRNKEISNLAKYSVCTIFKDKNSLLVQTMFVPVFFALNNVNSHEKYNWSNQLFGEEDRKTSLDEESQTFFSAWLLDSGNVAKRHRRAIYTTLINSLPDSSKLEIKNKLCKDVLQYYFVNKETSKRLEPSDLPKLSQLVEECFHILCSSEMQIKEVNNTNGAVLEDDLEAEAEKLTAQKAVQMAKASLMSKLNTKILLENIIPIVLKTYRAMQRSKSPMIKFLVPYLCDLYISHKKEVEEVLLTFQDDISDMDLHRIRNKRSTNCPKTTSKTILREIQYYLRQQEQEREAQAKVELMQEARNLEKAAASSKLAARKMGMLRSGITPLPSSASGTRLERRSNRRKTLPADVAFRKASAVKEKSIRKRRLAAQTERVPRKRGIASSELKENSMQAINLSQKMMELDS